MNIVMIPEAIITAMAPWMQAHKVAKSSRSLMVVYYHNYFALFWS